MGREVPRKGPVTTIAVTGPGGFRLGRSLEDAVADGVHAIEAQCVRDRGLPEVLGVSAVIALPTVILAFFYGQSRIFFTMARDGMLPQSLAKVSAAGTPVRITIFTAIVTSIFAGLIPLTAIAALANAGTLAAFVAVCASDSLSFCATGAGAGEVGAAVSIGRGGGSAISSGAAGAGCRFDASA